MISRDLPSKIRLQLKWLWIWTLAAFFCICGMTILGYVFKIQVIYWFGIFLICIYLIYMPLQARNRDTKIINFLFLLSIILAAFVTMLKLGGIVTSMGVIFVGLSSAFSSVLLNNARLTMILFIIYSLTILLTALLQPFLTVPDYVTPASNLLFYVLNILWISGTTLMFLLFYFKQQRDIDESEAKRLKELDEAKTRLYTNITHEFRTPLTIILGMVDLIEKKHGNAFAREALEIRAKGKKLRHLINQMLDLSKLESGMMRKDLKNGNIILYLKYITESFRSYAESRNIRIEFFSQLQAFNMDYDPDKLMHIVSNLLSNALKYSKEGGIVILRTLLKEVPGQAKSFVFEVEDAGIGIDEKDLEYIFNRFYRAYDTDASFSSGTGLGLSLTKEFVHLLNGNITVKSRLKEGTVFSVILPVENNATQFSNINYEGIAESIMPYVDHELDFEYEYPDLINEPYEDEKPILLIVEDNRDVIHYLVEILKDKYSIEIAYNGLEGIEKAIKVIPDIIISDLMMPVMDGYEFLEKVKTDIRTSHIPFVILTAKADNTSEIEGFTKGSDAFLPKPFNQNELFIRIENLIESRKKIQEHFFLYPQKQDKTNIGTLPLEEAFLKQVRDIMENNLANENFGISQLCREISMSRAQLYRKFKALTNQTVSKHIRSVRLNKARELLSSTDLTVSEIAFQVGYKSVSHFSTHFTREFGINPSKVNI